MVFPILGANTESAAYEVSNSVRLAREDGGDLSRAPSSDGNRQIWTFSTWFKFGRPVYDVSGADYDIMSANSTNNFNDAIRLDSNGKLTYLAKVSGDTANGIKGSTPNLLRDPTAWYHIVVAVDSTQATNSNGLKMYVNGVQQTVAFNSYNQSINTSFNKSGSTMSIGHFENDGGNHFDGYMCDTYWIDGTQYAADNFGEFNTNGVWVPKAASVSFGTNGFFLEFKQTGTSQNSSGIGADTSGNDNHLAVTNIASTDSALADTCTNNFCTLNPVAVKAGGETNYTSRIVKANLGADTTNNSDSYSFFGTMPTDMPFYYELKFLDVHSGGNDIRVGISREEMTYQSGSHAEAHYRNSGDIHSFASDGSNVASANSGNQSFSDNDIIGVAADNTTNNNVKFYHNGTLQATINIDANELYQPYVRLYGNSTETEFSINFGNPHYSISSGNSDANGYGNFEYDVPSGYYALCTKNLAEYG